MGILTGYLLMDIKPLNTFTNVGDTLSSINFNFTCLDIKVCNLQTDASTKWNLMYGDDNWGSSFMETLAMSSNWEDVKQHVHSTSAYWDQRVCTMFYPSVFPEGQASISQVQTWINTNFPASNYRDGQVFLVYFMEWYKDPRLHTPPSQSVSKFGQLSRDNNVHVKKINEATFEAKSGIWAYSQKLHFPKSCSDACDPCWGERHYATHPICYPNPVYYQLSCVDSVVDTDAAVEPCVLLDTDLVWEFSTNKNALLSDSVYLGLEATNLKPYTIGQENSFNPQLDQVNGDVYNRYINESSIPVVDQLLVERLSGFHIQFNYSYITSAGEFTQETTFSSMCAGEFGLSANIEFPFNFKNSEMRTYLELNDYGALLGPESSACPFRFEIDTTWYRWVLENASLSASPYWHIGTEPGSALGFEFTPEAGVPDSPADWQQAYTVLGDSLSAYFGTFSDMMGGINDIKIFALSG
jgi:hypothetical protein